VQHRFHHDGHVILTKTVDVLPQTQKIATKIRFKWIGYIDVCDNGLCL